MSVTNTNKQTIVCMEKKKKKRKKRTNIMSYLCPNKTSVLSSNDRLKQKPITLTCRTEAGFSKYTNFCSSEKVKRKISLSNSILLNRDEPNIGFMRKS